MANPTLPDPTTPFGARVRRRLAEERTVWVTTVGNDGTPQPNPVWFIPDGDLDADPSLLVYNLASANRLKHLAVRPNVALHFDTNGAGGDIVVLRGHAEVAKGEPPAHERPEFVEKYGEAMTSISGSPEAFAATYSVPLRITITGVRGY